MTLRGGALATASPRRENRASALFVGSPRVPSDRSDRNSGIFVTTNSREQVF